VGETGCRAGCCDRRSQLGCRLMGRRSRLGRGLGLGSVRWMFGGRGRREGGKVPFEPRSWVNGLEGKAMFASDPSSSYHRCRCVIDSLTRS
jgi:hypothetical protein